MTRYVPVVIVIHEDALAAIRRAPEYAALERELADADGFAVLRDRNGWTADMMILGSALAALADEEPAGRASGVGPR